MHILVANNLYPPFIAGGAERIVAYLCEGLVKRGHRVTVVSTCGPDMEPYPTETLNGVEVIRFFPPNFYWSFARARKPGARKILWHMRDAWNRAAGHRLTQIMRAERPDILHTHLIDGFSASIWGSAQRRNIPVLHTAHDYHLLCPRAVMLTRNLNVCTQPKLPCRLYRRWHIETTRHVDVFTSPSHFLLELHKREGLQARAHDVVHNGIPLPPRSTEIEQRDPHARHRRFLLLSRLTIEKGIRVVLDAVARLPPALPIEVAIAGTGPLENCVRTAAAHDRRITYHGFVDGDAKAEMLERAGYLLLPSLWFENAPVSIVEAAANGIGLIGSDIGAIPEFVEHGKTGVLFAPGDSEALAAIMMRAAQNPAMLPQLDASASAFASRFSLARMIDRYEEHYDAMLSRRRVAAAS